MFQYIGAKSKKNWNGHSFFGLDRKDFSIAEGTSELKSLNCERNNIVHPNTAHSETREATWLGVISFGTPNLNTKLCHVTGRKCILLQPGHETIRLVRTDSAVTTLHCKIEYTDAGPIFKCFNPNKPFINCESNVITAVIKDVFNKLQYKPKKRSGYEFFRLLKPEVLKCVLLNENLNNGNNRKQKCLESTKKNCAN